MADRADDSVRLTDSLGIGRASVIGLSMGGTVAQMLAARKPDRLDKLLLANTTPYALANSRWQARAAAARLSGLEPLGELTMERMFFATISPDPAQEVERTRRTLCSTDPEGFALACEALASFDARIDLRLVSTPTLVITGEQDEVSPPALGERSCGWSSAAGWRSCPRQHI